MAKLLLFRDERHVRENLETLHTLKEKKPVVIIGGENVECFGFFDKTITYVRTPRAELLQFEGEELSLETTLAQCPARHFFLEDV
jgi:hypothetical protein